MYIYECSCGLLFLHLDLPACTNDFWEYYPGSLSPSLSTPGSATDRYDCLDQCEAAGDCVGVNWDSAGNVCELFSDATPMAPVTSLVTSATGGHYRRCDVITGKCGWAK